MVESKGLWMRQSSPCPYSRIPSEYYNNMAWKKEQITLEDGRVVDAQAPEIVSASRSTDIPAFYCDFFHRLAK